MRNIKAIAALPFKVNEWQDITDTLPRKTTGDWEPDRKPEEIKYISVHHSAVENGTIQGYANNHVNTQGWRSIGYHIVIKGNQTYQVNDLLSFTYHTSGHNNNTIGISVSADFSKRDITEDEKNNLYAAILTCMALFNIPVENVLGHKEFSFNATLCPVISMDKVRNDIRTIQNQMEYAKTDVYAKVAAQTIGNQIIYLCNMLNGRMPDGTEATPGNIAWAKSVLLDLAPFMKERGLL